MTDLAAVSGPASSPSWSVVVGGRFASDVNSDGWESSAIREDNVSA